MGRKAHGTFIHSPWQASTRGRFLTQNLPCLLKSDIHSFLCGNFREVEGTLYSWQLDGELGLGILWDQLRMPLTNTFFMEIIVIILI